VTSPAPANRLNTVPFRAVFALGWRGPGEGRSNDGFLGPNPRASVALFEFALV
jgi:hypothetical protein